MSVSRWIPRIGGCGPMWLAMWSGGRSPGKWRRPASLLAWQPGSPVMAQCKLGRPGCGRWQGYRARPSM